MSKPDIDRLVREFWPEGCPNFNGSGCFAWGDCGPATLFTVMRRHDPIPQGDLNIIAAVAVAWFEHRRDLISRVSSLESAPFAEAAAAWRNAIRWENQ